MSEHCVRVYLKVPYEMEYEDFMEAVYELEDDLIDAIQAHKAGEFDGDELGSEECILYMYGPDADRLFEAVSNVLRASPLARGGYAIKRYGPPEDGVREERVDL